MIQSRPGVAVPTGQPRPPMLLAAADAITALLRGSTLMTTLLARTLGPHAGTVLAVPAEGQGCPEVLSRAGTVARRIVEISDPFENMGLLLARHAACAVDAQVGDGVATSAVILQHLLTTATRLVTAGYSTRLLAQEINDAFEHLLTSLRGSRLLVDPADAAAAVVAQALPEAALADAAVRALEGVGPDGWIEIRAGHRVSPSVEFVEGMRLRGEVAICPSSAAALPVATHEIGPNRVVVWADPLTDVAELAGLLDRVALTGAGSLLLIAPSMPEPTRRAAAAMASSLPSLQVLAITLGGTTSEDVLRDVAAYCGTRPMSATAGDRLATLDLTALGKARRAWATDDECGIVSSAGHSAARDRATCLRRQLDSESDPDERSSLRRRIAALTGSVALLAVPGVTDVELAERRARVGAAVQAGQQTAVSGVVAGAGAALAVADTGQATLGALALRDAVAEPLRHIAHRAGLNAAMVLEQTRDAAPGSRFDVVQRRWLSGSTAQVVDPLAVVECAVRTAVSTAVTVLTSAVALRSARPQRSLTP